MDGYFKFNNNAVRILSHYHSRLLLMLEFVYLFIYFSFGYEPKWFGPVDDGCDISNCACVRKIVCLFVCLVLAM